MIGEVLGSYAIERKLGEGGMGEVFLATHRRIARRAAVKVLLPEFSREPEILNRFFNEARTTSLIEHPNIVEVLDCDVHTSGRAFIVMEYLHGEGLSAALRRVGSMADDLGAVLGLMTQIVGAVGAAHAKGIVHRDLKPDNIFLLATRTPGSAPLVKILDFGIAKLAAGGAAGTKTRTGSLLGTPLYMSPEQCRGAQQVDHRADIYSLGCVLYEMLTGRPPFIRDGAGDLIIAHVIEPPQAPSALGVVIPPAMEQLVLHMLAKAPEQRPASLIDVGARIAAIGAAVGQPPSRLTVVEPPALLAPPATAVLTPASFTPPPPVVAAIAAIAGGTALLPVVSESPAPPATSGRTPPPGGGGNDSTSQTTLSRAAGELAQRAPRARGYATTGEAAPPPAKRRIGLWVGVGGAAAVAVVVAVGAIAFRGPGGGGSGVAPEQEPPTSPANEAAPTAAAAAPAPAPTPAPTPTPAAAPPAAAPTPPAPATTPAAKAPPEPTPPAEEPKPAIKLAPAEAPPEPARSPPGRTAAKPESKPAGAGDKPRPVKKKTATASRPTGPGGRKLPAPITDIE